MKIRPLTKKTSVIWLAFGAVLVLVSTVAFRSGSRQPIAGKIERGTVIDAVYAIGTVTASRTYQLKLGVNSTVLALHVREGDQLRKGDPVVTLDSFPVFRAPFSGTVTWIGFKPGETVFPQSPVISMTDLGDRYILASLEQKGALQVEKGQKVQIRFDSLKEQRLEGRVRSVFAHEQQFLVHIEVGGLPAKILPGMTADLGIVIRSRENAITAPAAAIGQTNRIAVLRDGREKSVEIAAGVVNGDRVELIQAADLREGEAVLLAEKR